MNKFAGFARGRRSGFAGHKDSRRMKCGVYLVDINSDTDRLGLGGLFRAVRGSWLDFGTPCASR